jgi:hypothetical protein
MTAGASDEERMWKQGACFTFALLLLLVLMMMARVCCCKLTQT